jgi:hypothetical protein
VTKRVRTTRIIQKRVAEMTDNSEIEERGPPNGSGEATHPLAVVFGFVVLLGALGALLLVLYRIYPAHLPEKENPGFLDAIFANHLVVFAARLVLFSLALVLAFAAGYTIVSIVQWVRQRRWLARAGPFEVSREAVETLQAQVELWQSQALKMDEHVQELAAELEASERIIEGLMSNREEG